LKQLGLGKGPKIFDFGCSWGYGSYQLIKAGFDVISYEISSSRRQFAREKLGLNTIDDVKSAFDTFASHFDCF
jgi:cyclopropane fatty-acyl-phospholipid synthase-like methyltransferase